MSDEPDLQKRLDTFSRTRRRSNRSRFGVTALALALGLGGAGVAYFLASDWNGDPDGLQTSDVEPFQNDRIRTGGRLEFPEDETNQRVSDALIAVEDALDLPALAPPETEPDADVLLHHIDLIRDYFIDNHTQ